jgi:two-component system chemotaxis response regulator CheB
MHRDLIVIGASAGGIEPLVRLVEGLPEALPAAICVVVHLPATGTSRLDAVLGRRTQLEVVRAAHGMDLRPGRIHLAPSDQHLLVAGGRLELSRGTRENYSRPSIDVLFRSAALSAGERTIGVILSGTLSDGVAGMRAIKEAGGIAVVQDPEDALFRDMPERVAAAAQVDHLVPASELGVLMAELVAGQAPHGAVGATAATARLEREGRERQLEAEVSIVESVGSISSADRPGRPSGFGCPECGGVLWEIDEADSFRFRCRVGHAYSADALLAGESRSIEDALRTAVRALEEQAELRERLADRMRERDLPRVSADYGRRAREAREQAGAIRHAILRGTAAAETDGAPDERELGDAAAEERARGA